jgi:hypothetical protein
MRTKSATPRQIPLVLTLVLLLAICLAGCASPPPSPTATPTPEPTETPTPTPIPPPSQPETDPSGPEVQVDPGEVVAIGASAEGAVEYEWTLQGEGEIEDPTAPTILYTAPDEVGAMAVVTVTAYNDGGASPQTSLTIIVAVPSVPLDAVGVPAGWMSGGDDPANYIKLDSGAEGECHTGSDCLRVTYTSGGGFGGIFWWPPGCGESGTDEAWGKVTAGICGTDVTEAGNLSTVDRLTFWARGDQGDEAIEFKVGAGDILPIPGRSLGKVSLTPAWEQYEIDLEDVDMTDAIGLFAWIAADLDNPEGAVFYLDDIQFEGTK